MYIAHFYTLLFQLDFPDLNELNGFENWKENSEQIVVHLNH